MHVAHINYDIAINAAAIVAASTASAPTAKRNSKHWNDRKASKYSKHFTL